MRRRKSTQACGGLSSSSWLKNGSWPISRIESARRGWLNSASACASLRLYDSLRKLPTSTATSKRDSVITLAPCCGLPPCGGALAGSLETHRARHLQLILHHRQRGCNVLAQFRRAHGALRGAQQLREPRLVGEHCAQVGVVELLAVHDRKLRAQLRVLGVEFARRADVLVRGDRHQFAGVAFVLLDQVL